MVPLSAVPLAPLAGASAAGDGLDVSELQFEPGNDAGTAFWIWVNVTNGAKDAALNVTGEVSGAQVMTPPTTSADSSFQLGRGASHDEPFEATVGASIGATATVTSGAPLSAIRVTLTAPDGTTFPGSSGHSSSVNLAPSDAGSASGGAWTATVDRVRGLTSVSCSLSISVSYAAAEPTQSVDNISAGGDYSFRWMVKSDSPPDPPAGASIVVTATVLGADGTPEQQVFRAALGKPVVDGSAAATDAAAGPLADAGVGLVVAAVWGLVPIAAYVRLRQRQQPAPGASPQGARDPWGLRAGPMLRKVPEITLYFWVIKVLCTTVGETAADQINGTSLGAAVALGLSGTNLLMAGLMATALVLQFTSNKYVPAFYWTAVVFISVVGTLITDHLHDDLGLGLDAATAIFAVVLAAVFLAWYRSERTLSIHSIYTTRREVFYWAAILATFALGTASGDLVLERLGAAFGQGPSVDDPSVMVPLYPQAALLASAVIFAGVIAFAFLGPRFLKMNAVLAFWIAYIFTRPLGANIGDLLTLSPVDGGIGLGKEAVNLVFLSAIIASIVYLTVTRRDVFEAVGGGAGESGRAVLGARGTAAAPSHDVPDE